MNFEVYCDESYPDLFTTSKPDGRYLLIGSLWIESEIRSQVKDDIKELRNKHQVFGEIKWSKVSPSKLKFYKEVVSLFMKFGMQMRFRCIAVDAQKVNFDLHHDDQELGFYKFYYQLLHHWILDFNQYDVFCDLKTNRDLKRLQTLHDCLQNANLSSQINRIQGLPSKEVVLLQISDLLLGLAASRMNNCEIRSQAKEELASYLESKLNVKRIGPTPRREHKFNVFKIELAGGW